MPPCPRYLRKPLAAMLACVLVASCGCHGLRGIFRAPGPTAPTVLTTMPTSMDIVGAVNANTARVRSYYADSASFTVPGLAGLPMMRGKIALERPQNFRLTAGMALGGDEIDLGSNDEMLWFWVKHNSPPAFYFCRHDQYATSGAPQMLPIDPTWIGDALGLVELNPSAQYEGPFARKEGLLLRSSIQSPTGPMIREIVVDPEHAWVVEQYLRDTSGNLIATAKAKDFRYDQQANVSLPRSVTITVPASDLSLSINVGNVAINNVIPNATLTWSPPSLANYPRVDLGSIPPGMAYDPSILPPQTVVPNQPEPTPYIPSAQPPYMPPAGQSPYSPSAQSTPVPTTVPVTAPATVGPASYTTPSISLAPEVHQLPAGGVAIEPSLSY